MLSPTNAIAFFYLKICKAIQWTSILGKYGSSGDTTSVIFSQRTSPKVNYTISFPTGHHNNKIIFISDVFVINFFFAGIFAAAQIVLPKDCKGNKFCEIVKMIVGPTVKWYITGHFQWKKIRVATGFANVRIFDGLYFHKLELYVEVSCQKDNHELLTRFPFSLALYRRIHSINLFVSVLFLHCFRLRKAMRFCSCCKLVQY